MNEREREASIELILAKGLVKPQSARTDFAEMVRKIGLRHIFWDTGFSLLFAAVTLAVIFPIFFFALYDYRYSAAVSLAPLVFLLLTVFSETAERFGGLYELKQTCRYTIRQITTLRVVCYSVLGVVFTAIISAVSAKSAYEFLSILLLCLSALFICAVLSLSVIRYVKGKWASAVYSGMWVLVSAALPFSLKARWENVLSGVPTLISALIALVGAAVLIYQISRMISEAGKYAIA